MRDHHNGGRDLAHEEVQLVLHDLAHLEVDGPERLVQQKHLRPAGQGAHDSDALLHAAGELDGILPLVPLEVGQLEQLVQPRLLFFPGLPGYPQRVEDVRPNGHPRKERVVLKDVAAFHARPLDGAPLQSDLPLRAGLEPGQDSQQGRLATPRRAQQRDELPLTHLEREVVDNGPHEPLPVREGLFDVVNGQQRHLCISIRSGCVRAGRCSCPWRTPPGPT